MRRVSAIVMLVLTAACSKGGGNGDTIGNTVTQPSTGYPVIIRITGTAAVTFTFQNQTITSAGSNTFNGLQAGTYTVSGQFSAGPNQQFESVIVGSPNAPGGGTYADVVTNVTNLTGPGAPNGCGVNYTVPSTSATNASVAFSFQFSFVDVNSIAQANRCFTQ